MVKKDSHIHVWCIDLSLHNNAAEKFSAVFKKYDIILDKFNPKSEEDFGLVLVSDNAFYEQLISVLHVQLKPRNNRIIVINISQLRFSEIEVLKILNYGAEYFFESSLVDNNYDCIIEKIKRWRNIESIMESSNVRKSIVGKSLMLKKLLRSIIEVAVYSTASVLILGDRGTGKELIARLIHD